MTWLLVAVATIAVVEAFLFLPFVERVRRLWSSYSKAVRTISSKRISDHWKEKVLVVYAASIFFDSITVFIILGLAFSPILAAIFAGNFLGLDVYRAIMSVEGILFTCVFSLLYLLVRRKAFGRL